MTHVKTKIDPSGIWTALITPMTSRGDIDWNAFITLLDEQMEAGIRGVVISGSTGEGTTLAVQERLSLVRKAKAHVKGDMQIMAGSGLSATDQTLELSKLCLEAGADSLLVVTPPYNKPSLAGLKIHYQTICENTNAPICLYHVPSRTGQYLSADAIAELTSIKHIFMVKEASGDLGFYTRCINKSLLKSSAIFLSGDDHTFLPSVSVGGKGVISVLSNYYPKPFVDLWKYTQAGDWKKALHLHNALFPFMEALTLETNPGAIKAALAHRGIGADYMRPPLASMTLENREKLVKAILQTDENLKKS